MDLIGSWATLAASVALLGVTLLAWRERLPRRWIDIFVIVGSAGLAIGGLSFLEDVGIWSWVVAPILLAACGVLQPRLL